MARRASKKKSTAKATRAAASAPEREVDELPSTGTLGWLLKLLAVAAGLGVSYWLRQTLADEALANSSGYLPRKNVPPHQHVNVACYAKEDMDDLDLVPGCHHVGDNCGRAVRDSFVTLEEVDQLREIAEVGMAGRSKLGGPTIMDVNTGFVKDGDGLVNIYQKDRSSPPVPRFTTEQFALYRDVIEKIRLAVMEEFKLEVLYFTAPTFITRIVGNSSWEPTEIHDEYWHPHVDKDNTDHYDYSGLLYLADYEDDFTGGLFAFIDEESEMVIEPARARLMMFTAGKENLHQVRKVESGTRYVMSMWFSCDERKQFHNFLDGKMHQHFKREEEA